MRKKLHVGEFQEYGFEIVLFFYPNLSDFEFDKFLTEFIDLIEENKLLFGGGGYKEIWQGFITSAKKYESPSKAQIEKIEIWLKDRNEILELKIGNCKDAWNDG